MRSTSNGTSSSVAKRDCSKVNMLVGVDIRADTTGVTAVLELLAARADTAAAGADTDMDDREKVL